MWPWSATLMLLFAVSLSGQAQDTNSSWKASTDSHGSDSLNPIRTSVKHTENGARTVDTQSLERIGPDGRYVPYQDIEKETVQVSSGEVRTVTRTFVRDSDGGRTLFQVTEERQVSAGGNSQIVRTTSNAGPDGLQIVQRDVQETKRTGSGSEETRTTTYLPGLDGLAPAMQTDDVQHRTGKTVEMQKTTLLPDGEGRWQVGEVRKSTVNEDDKKMSREETVSRPDLDGRMSEISRTLRSEAETAPGQKSQIEDAYSTDTPGVAPDGKLHLVQRTTTRQQTSPTGEQSTRTNVEQPNPGDPSAGLELTSSTTNTVSLGASDARGTVTVSFRDANGSLKPIAVGTTNSDNASKIQIQIGPPDTKTADQKPSGSKN